MSKKAVKIISSLPLNEEERQKTLFRAQKVFGRDLVPEYEIDPKIIGGLVIRSEDKILDLSVAAKLDQLKVLLENN